MKVLPDDKTVVVDDVDTDGSAVSVLQIYSSQSEQDVVGEQSDEKNNNERVNEEEEEEEETDENSNNRRRSKKKHKKHHHKRDAGSLAVRKKHKKRKKRVDPIFLWAQKRETKIVKVVCEDYDRHNRIRLVRTSSGLWSSNPRSKVLSAAKSRSSVFEYDDESQKDTNDESESEPDTRPAEPEKVDDKPKEVCGAVDKQSAYVDLNDNSIDFVDTTCAEEDEEEQRARIDRALEMINQDPALVEDVKTTLSPVKTANIKLPEGTTIHQVKAENDVSVDKPVRAIATSAETLVQQQKPCTYGELTVIPQQPQQNEPLNLETVGKRSALEIRLQEPPFKKKRVAQSPSPHPSVVGGGVPVKREWGALCELKEVLADPRLSVPDPLLVPRARLAALVASPATEIPKLLQTKSLLPFPPPENDLLAVSLSNLQSIVQQQPPDFMGDGGNQPSNIEQMLWLSYLSSKEMTGMDADLLLGLLLPNSTTSQKSFNYAPPKNQWNDIYYNGTGLPPPPTPSQFPPAPYGSSPVQRQSQLPSPQPRKRQQSPGHQQQQNHKTTFPPQHKSRLPLPPSSPAKQRVVCQDLCCTGSPTVCYEGCCPTKAIGCNPFAVSPNGCNAFAMSPNGCNPFAVSPSGCNPFVMSPSGCNPFATSPTGGGGFYPSANFSKSCTAYNHADPVPTTCCFSPDVGFGFAGGQQKQQSSSPMPPHKSSSTSSSPRNRVPYNYQTGFPPPSQHQKPSSTDPSDRGPIAEVVAAGIDPLQSLNTAAGGKQQSAAVPIAGGDVSVHKPKIKVKKHLIDPNAKPKLLNIEGALHLAGANPQDLFSSPLWHPLFGR